ncbi:MAG: hypothetical protein KDC44_10780 [Phaeodactylibacter sp.]|nr:hypothetical protein [Phaeodactylibacter sp.]
MKATYFMLFAALVFTACKDRAGSKFPPVDRLAEIEQETGLDPLDHATTNKVSVQKDTEQASLSITLSVEEISFNGLQLKDTKARMTAIMGQPDSIAEPRYDCGPFSEDAEGVKFYQYFFGTMNFIVYEDIAEVQGIQFQKDETLKLRGALLHGKMNFEQVLRALEINRPDKAYQDDVILIYPSESLDENYLLLFKDGVLSAFDRFEPC